MADLQPAVDCDASSRSGVALSCTDELAQAPLHLEGNHCGETLDARRFA
jgi:hypothetical protein